MRRGKIGWGTPETRAKLSEAQRKNWADPTYRERLSNALKAARKRGNYPPPKPTLPPWGTVERRQFNKIRVVLGTKVARETMGLSQ